jgi:Fe-S cluster biogenesis protein NfuA
MGKVNCMPEDVSLSLDEKIEHIKDALEKLRPAILSDGGDIHSH